MYGDAIDTRVIVIKGVYSAYSLVGVARELIEANTVARMGHQAK